MITISPEIVQVIATEQQVTVNVEPQAVEVQAVEVLSVLPETNRWVIGETPSGTVNGSNANFSTSFDFIPETVQLLHNGLELTKLVDFTTSGTRNIIMNYSPDILSYLRVNYLKA